MVTDTVTVTTATVNDLQYYFNGDNAFDIDLDSIFLKEIAIPADSVWEATVTGDPKIVLFADTLGKEELTLVGVDAVSDWFWESNILYTY